LFRLRTGAGGRERSIVPVPGPRNEGTRRLPRNQPGTAPVQSAWRSVSSFHA